MDEGHQEKWLRGLGSHLGELHQCGCDSLLFLSVAAIGMLVLTVECKVATGLENAWQHPDSSPEEEEEVAAAQWEFSQQAEALLLTR